MNVPFMGNYNIFILGAFRLHGKFNYQLGKVLFPLLSVLKNITLTIKKSERWQTYCQLGKGNLLPWQSNKISKTIEE